jgi:hypothetical protein
MQSSLNGPVRLYVARKIMTCPSEPSREGAAYFWIGRISLIPLVLDCLLKVGFAAQPYSLAEAMAPRLVYVLIMYYALGRSRVANVINAVLAIGYIAFLEILLGHFALGPIVFYGFWAILAVIGVAEVYRAPKQPMQQSAISH